MFVIKKKITKRPVYLSKQTGIQIQQHLTLINNCTHWGKVTGNYTCTPFHLNTI